MKSAIIVLVIAVLVASEATLATYWVNTYPNNAFGRLMNQAKPWEVKASDCMYPHPAMMFFGCNKRADEKK